MSSVRRWYIFLVATISMHAVAWAVIELLRNVLGVWGRQSTNALAFQVAVIVIGLPIFLIHWLWAQWLATDDPDEHGAVLRQVYLYGNMAALLTPALGSVYDLARGLLGRLLDPNGYWHGDAPFSAERSTAQGMIGSLIPILVLGLLWFYQWRVARADRAALPPNNERALVRRVYILGSSLMGMVIASQSLVALLRWLLYQFDRLAQADGSALISPLAGLIVGLPLWLIAWRVAQRLFHGPDPSEHTSVLRTFYLHATIFFSAFATVSGATVLLVGLLRQILGLPAEGDIRDQFPLMLVAAAIWLYHNLTLRADTALIAELPRQAGVRRLSWYLVSSIGLSASLYGLASLLSVLIQTLAAPNFTIDLRDQLAWALASLIAGLPVWVLTWRQAQGKAALDSPDGERERGSLVRRIYLYGFIFVATLTILSGLVYIVFRLLRMALGEPGDGYLLVDLAQAIAYSALAVGVLLYHGALLRAEGRLQQDAELVWASELRVAVLDLDDGRFGRAVVERLRHEVPGLTLNPIGLTPAAASEMGVPPSEQGLTEQLADAGLIIGPWRVIVASLAGSEIAQAVERSPARKLLLPTPVEGWAWAGVEPWNGEAAIAQIVHAVRQVLNGEPIHPLRPRLSAVVIGSILGTILLLFIGVVILIVFVLIAIF